MFRVKVGDDLIQKCDQKSSSQCPIATAILGQTYCELVSVTDRKIGFIMLSRDDNGNKIRNHCLMDVSLPLYQWIESYDRDKDLVHEIEIIAESWNITPSDTKCDFEVNGRMYIEGEYL